MKNIKHVFRLKVGPRLNEFSYTGMTEPEARSQFVRDATAWLQEQGYEVASLSPKNALLHHFVVPFFTEEVADAH